MKSNLYDLLMFADLVFGNPIDDFKVATKSFKWFSGDEVDKLEKDLKSNLDKEKNFPREKFKVIQKYLKGNLEKMEPQPVDPRPHMVVPPGSELEKNQQIKEINWYGKIFYPWADKFMDLLLYLCLISISFGGILMASIFWPFGIPVIAFGITCGIAFRAWKKYFKEIQDMEESDRKKKEEASTFIIEEDWLNLKKVSFGEGEFQLQQNKIYAKINDESPTLVDVVLHNLQEKDEDVDRLQAFSIASTILISVIKTLHSNGDFCKRLRRHFGELNALNMVQLEESDSTEAEELLQKYIDESNDDLKKTFDEIELKDMTSHDKLYIAYMISYTFCSEPAKLQQLSAFLKKEILFENEANTIDKASKTVKTAFRIFLALKYVHSLKDKLDFSYLDSVDADLKKGQIVKEGANLKRRITYKDDGKTYVRHELIEPEQLGNLAALKAICTNNLEKLLEASLASYLTVTAGSFILGTFKDLDNKYTHIAGYAQQYLPKKVYDKMNSKYFRNSIVGFVLIGATKYWLFPNMKKAVVRPTVWSPRTIMKPVNYNKAPGLGLNRAEAAKTVTDSNEENSNKTSTNEGNGVNNNRKELLLIAPKGADPVIVEDESGVPLVPTVEGFNAPAVVHNHDYFKSSTAPNFSPFGNNRNLKKLYAYADSPLHSIIRKDWDHIEQRLIDNANELNEAGFILPDRDNDSDETDTTDTIELEGVDEDLEKAKFIEEQRQFLVKMEKLRNKHVSERRGAVRNAQTLFGVKKTYFSSKPSDLLELAKEDTDAKRIELINGSGDSIGWAILDEKANAQSVIESINDFRDDQIAYEKKREKWLEQIQIRQAAENSTSTEPGPKGKTKKQNKKSNSRRNKDARARKGQVWQEGEPINLENPNTEGWGFLHEYMRKHQTYPEIQTSTLPQEIFASHLRRLRTYKKDDLESLGFNNQRKLAFKMKFKRHKKQFKQRFGIAFDVVKEGLTLSDTFLKENPNLPKVTFAIHENTQGKLLHHGTKLTGPFEGQIHATVAHSLFHKDGTPKQEFFYMAKEDSSEKDAIDHGIKFYLSEDTRGKTWNVNYDMDKFVFITKQSLPGLRSIALYKQDLKDFPKFVTSVNSKEKMNVTYAQLKGDDVFYHWADTDQNVPCGKPLIEVNSKQLVGIHFAAKHSPDKWVTNMAYSTLSHSFLELVDSLDFSSLN
jgi:hypothetical protein